MTRSRADSRKVGRGKAVFELALEDRAEAADLFRSVYAGHAASTVRFRWKYRLCWRTKPNRRLPRPGSARPGPTFRSLDQDSWHQGKITCDRRGDLRRHTSQRHPVSLRRPVSRGCQSVHPRHQRRIDAGLKVVLAPSHRSSLVARTSQWPESTGAARRAARRRGHQADLRSMCRLAEFAARRTMMRDALVEFLGLCGVLLAARASQRWYQSF